MLIQTILTIWLLALVFLTNKFRREEKIHQQRIFSVFLIIWAILAVAYYDVWAYTSGELDQGVSPWQTYLPAAFFSICAGLGTYYLMMTFGKFRAMNQKNQQQADQEKAARKQQKAGGVQNKAAGTNRSGKANANRNANTTSNTNTSGKKKKK